MTYPSPEVDGDIGNQEAREGHEEEHNKVEEYCGIPARHWNESRDRGRVWLLLVYPIR